MRRGAGARRSQKVSARTGKQTRLGRVADGKRGRRAGGKEPFVAVLPEPDRGMTGVCEKAVALGLEDEAVVSEEAVTGGGKCGGERGLAAAGFGEEGDGTVSNFDGAGMKDEFARLAER